MATTLDGDTHVNGHLSAKTAALPAGTVTNAMVNGSAAIACTKMQKPRLFYYSQNGTATSVTVPIYECRGATATIQNLRCGSIVANIGAATVTVDLKKNGTTVLTGVVTLDNANTARVAEAGTLSVTSMVQGDWLEIVTVATAGGGTLATGLLVQAEVFEDQ
jgi:hypothetical protein